MRAVDYVVVKLDVDNSEVELALVHQLLNMSTRGRSPLVDEIFWEHHVWGSPMACPEMWGSKAPSGWAYMDYPSREAKMKSPDASLKGSYRLFRQLREKGIRAHSWV